MWCAGANKELKHCRPKACVIALNRDRNRGSVLSMRYLRLMMHDSQTTQELGVQRDDHR